MIVKSIVFCIVHSNWTYY